MFSCPSRRKCIAYPYIHPNHFTNINYNPLIGRSDYAANGGDGSGSENTCWYGPGSYAEGGRNERRSLGEQGRL